VVLGVLEDQLVLLLLELRYLQLAQQVLHFQLARHHLEGLQVQQVQLVRLVPYHQLVLEVQVFPVVQVVLGHQALHLLQLVQAYHIVPLLLCIL